MCGFRAHPGKQFTKTYLFYLFYLGFQASGGLDVVDTYVATYTHIYIYISIDIYIYRYIYIYIFGRCMAAGCAAAFLFSSFCFHTAARQLAALQLHFVSTQLQGS